MWNKKNLWAVFVVSGQHTSNSDDLSSNPADGKIKVVKKLEMIVTINDNLKL